ncbi:MAG: ATP-dependent DNA helicase RecQ [Rikenellaceae bacterium]
MGRQKNGVAKGDLGLSTLQILQKYWGYSEFRSSQLQIIDSVLSGRDTLALMPTGGGKSITYQIPALMRDGVCVVVSPLIALIKDQVDGLRRRGISAVAIHSGLSKREIDRALDNCIYGDIKFLYLSPERVETDLFLLRLQKMTVSMLAVDEAHCISQWGYDFRPSYLNISKVREVVPGIPILALSASATDAVAQDIMKQLHFESKHIIRTDFSRPNLSYVVRYDDNKRVQIEGVLRSVGGSGIIYVRTRDESRELCESLIKDGVSATYYNGGLPYAERMLRQEEWITDKCRVMVATNAFGMGIDKPDVRFVIHYSMCDSLEAYYQEAGRAGRDGKRSYALLLVGKTDEERIRKRVMLEFPPIDDVKSIYDSLCSYLAIAYDEGAFVSYKFNIYDFCRDHSLFGATIRSAFKILEMNGYLSYVEDAMIPSRVIFRVRRDDLYDMKISKPRLDLVMNCMLRLYGGIFSDLKKIDESEIAMWCQLTFDEVVEVLKELSSLRIIYYISSSKTPLIRLLKNRLKLNEIYISPDTYLHRQRMCEERIGVMLEYLDNKEMCRSSLLQSYFGEENPSPCGVCDVCLSRKDRVDPMLLTDDILEIISLQECDIQQLAERLKKPNDKVAECVERLIKSAKLRYEGPFLVVND